MLVRVKTMYAWNWDTHAVHPLAINNIPIGIKSVILISGKFLVVDEVCVLVGRWC